MTVSPLLHKSAPCILVVLGALISPSNAATGPIRESDQPRDHLVYLGLDIEVEHKEVSGRVADFSKGTLLVKSPFRTVPVDVQRVKSYSPRMEPKIAKVVVSVEDVEAERTYSPAADPVVRAMVTQSRLMAYQSELQDRADAAERHLLNTGAIAPAGPDNPGPGLDLGTGGGSTAAPPPGMAAQDPFSTEVLVSTIQQSNMIQEIDPNRIADAMIESGQGGFDTVEFTMNVSSPEVLLDAYAVIVSTIIAPEKPKTPLRVVTFSDLPTITDEPTEVKITQTGLPLGFEIGGYDIHIYSLGREIPTNHANNAVAVSWAEARDFLVLQRMVSNKHATLPAVVMRQMLSPENRSHIPVDQLDRTVQVRVDRFGGVKAIQFEPAGDPDTDAALADVIRRTPFFPALIDGQPTESNATVRMSEFIL